MGSIDPKASFPTSQREAELRWSQQLHRRSILRFGGLSLLGLSTPRLLRAEEQGRGTGTGKIPIRAKSVIFLFQWGGPSSIDMFDMKPNAPDTIRSPYKPIASSAPGLEVCELLPEMSKRMHHVSLIRTMTHKMKNHASAGYYALTGHEPPSDDQRLRDSLDLYPAYGSVVDRLSPGDPSLPTFVSYPYRISDGSIVPGQHASFLGKQHDPLFFNTDPAKDDFRLPELQLPSGVDLDRLMRRRSLQKLIDQQRRLIDHAESAVTLDRYYERAITMLQSDRLQQAFALDKEPAALRDRYGRHTYGQSCLLARRLVEAGVKFVTVYFSPSIGGQKTTEGGWDTHGFNNTRMYNIVDKYHMPITDQTLPTLLDDLSEKGLLDETLVVWMGEFGRTPKINDNVSRDHWPDCYTALLAGGGCKRGYAYGTSDKHCAYPAESPVRPEDLAATIYYLMGIDPATEIMDRNSRPLVIGGNPVYDVIA